jgi:colanic acid/amylovoran biosynthesis glycosyltransferase
MPATPLTSPASVIIPAHNEEAVIARCLKSLLEGAQDGELEVIVVCNGCDDNTALVARRVSSQVKVIEIAVASKVAALNAGDAEADHYPRFYVDADVELSIDAVRAVAAELAHGPTLCAAPKARFDLSGRSWPVRAFYDIWLGIPYHSQEMVGSGVYALSAQGRSRFGPFPELTADDQFVHQLFESSERKALPQAEFVVHPPRSLGGLLNMRVRAYRGNRELGSSGLAQASPPPSGAKAALRRASEPAKVPAVGVYVAINLLAKGLARRSKGQRWERDDSARRPEGTGPGVTGPGVKGPGGTGADEGDMGLGTVKVCYVTSHYPALSHTFVMREVMGVRAAGLQVATVSVHRADAAQLLAQVDIEEAAQTWDIFPLDKREFITAHATALLRHPRAYFGTLREAVSCAPPGLRGRLWQLFYFAEAIELWDHAQRQGIRHFHAHLANMAADISWLAAAFGRAAQPGQGWRWSFTMHGPTELYATDRFNLSQKVAHADAVICISDYTRSQLMYLSPPEHWAKIHIVHCGADLKRYPYVAPALGPRLSVLCVCRMVAEKGVQMLVDAVGELRSEGTEVELVLVGSGPLQDSLRARVAQLGLGEDIKFAGAVGQDDMAGYYARADAFCLPSFAEGVPVVLMEAMATGRPVIASRITGIPELVEDGVSGLLVPPGNLGHLTKALAELAGSPARRQSLGQAGRARVEQEFDAEKCAAELATIFTQLALAAGGA